MQNNKNKNDVRIGLSIIAVLIVLSFDISFKTALARQEEYGTRGGACINGCCEAGNTCNPSTELCVAQ